MRRFVALDPGDVVVGNKLRGLILRIWGFIKLRIEKLKDRKAWEGTTTTTEMNGVTAPVVVKDDDKGNHKDLGVDK